MRQLQHIMQPGDAENIRIDLSSWVADNSNITSATWTLKSGDLTLGTPTTTTTLTRCVITATNPTRARIVIKAIDGNQSVSITLLIRVVEPQDLGTYDYGWIE
jgi:hypothetical protein